MATIAEKRRAHKAVADAVASGSLTPARALACECCGYAAEVHHHADYAKPLDVMPLCACCHRGIHCGRMAEPRTGRMYPRFRRAHGIGVDPLVRSITADGMTTRQFADAHGLTVPRASTILRAAAWHGALTHRTVNGRGLGRGVHRLWRLAVPA